MLTDFYLIGTLSGSQIIVVKLYMSNRIAELANASIINIKDPGSNLGIESEYFLFLFCVVFEFKSVDCKLLRIIC
jgi:hypothetical protein